MTKTEKDRIVNEIMDRLIMLTEDDYKIGKATDGGRAEMLTIKECVHAVHGISEHTVRQMVAQGKVRSVRTGEGIRGKILVNKADLLKYLGAY